MWGVEWGGHLDEREQIPGRLPALSRFQHHATTGRFALLAIGGQYPVPGVQANHPRQQRTDQPAWLRHSGGTTRRGRYANHHHPGRCREQK